MDRLQFQAEFPEGPEQVAALLSELPLLRHVSEATLEKIVATLEPVRFGPGEPIVQVGGEGLGLYIIWKGEAKVTTPPSDSGNTYTKFLLTRGDYFGAANKGPLRKKSEVDVVAMNEVFSLVLAHEHAELLLECSVWDWSGANQLTKKVDDIFQLLTIEPDLFQTVARAGIRPTHLYGGQLIGQALLAAAKTVNPTLMVHSLHCYFLRTGDDNLPVMYKVERPFDGMSTATRHVQAVQKDKVIFVLYASFKVDVDGLEILEPMPNVPRPEEIPSKEQRFEDYLADPRVPLTVREKFAVSKMNVYLMETHYIDRSNRYQPLKLEPVVRLEPKQRVWFRCRSKLQGDQILHRCVGAYATDEDFLSTVLRPYPLQDFQILSLDHAIWFHGSFKADEWLLHVIEATAGSAGRVLCKGRVYTQDGKLVMTVAQEGVVRRVVKASKI